MATEIVERVRASIDAAAVVELDTLGDGELNAELMGLLRQRHRLDAQIARRAQRWEARTLWATDGSRSSAARLARDGLVAQSTAHEVLHAGRAVIKMPLAATAWTDGEISADHVALLGRAAGGGREELFARDEALLVEDCATMRYAQANKAVRYWCQRADTELNTDGTPPPPETYVRADTTFQGCLAGEFMLDPIGGGMVKTALGRIERELYRQDQRDGVERTKPERMAAALVEMAVRANTAPKDGRRPEPLLIIAAGEETFDHLCELADGTVVDAHLIVPYLARADIQTIVFDGAGRPICGSRQRTFRGMVRRAIQVRDQHCQHRSGCDAPISQCDVDHIVPDRAGGLTEVDNGRLQCEPHNRKSDLHDKAPAEALDDAIRRRAMDAALEHRIARLVAEREKRPPPGRPTAA